MNLRRSFGGGGGGGAARGGGGSMLRAFGRVVSARTGVAGSSAVIQEPVAPNGGGSGGNITSTTRPTSPRNASGGGQRLNRQLSLSAYSSPVSPRSSGFGASAWQGMLDEGDWVIADGGWEESQRRKDLYFDELVFGSIPSPEEVQGAVSAVQHCEGDCCCRCLCFGFWVFDSAAYSHLIKDRYDAYVDKEVTEISNGSGLFRGVSSGGANDDWIEPDVHLCNNDSTRALQPIGTDKVLDAFHLLQTDPSVQRMVISLSSDKAVWDAILNNEVVKELRKSCSSGEVTSLSKESPGEESNEANEVNEAFAVIKWILDNTVSRIMEVVDMMTRLVSDLFDDSSIDREASAKGGRADRSLFEEKLRTSFLLTLMVLLLVTVARARSA